MTPINRTVAASAFAADTAKFVDIRTNRYPVCTTPDQVPCVQANLGSSYTMVNIQLPESIAGAGGAVYSKGFVEERRASMASMAASVDTCSTMRVDDQQLGLMAIYVGQDGIRRNHCAFDLNFKRASTPYTACVTVFYQLVTSFVVNSCNSRECSYTAQGPLQYQTFAIADGEQVQREDVTASIELLDTAGNRVNDVPVAASPATTPRASCGSPWR